MTLIAKQVLHPLRLVLVAPQYAGNVGAIARVCANFEVADIRLVAPECRWNNADAKMFAKGAAADFLEGMKDHKTLTEALRGCLAAVAFTRRQGELRRPSVTLAEIAALGRESVQLTPRSGPVALVFGREDSGLTSSELAVCTQVCTLRVGATMPSLNLSHAVAVVLGRLYEEGAFYEGSSTSERPPDRRERAADLDELAVLFEHWKNAMIDAGITTAGNPERMLGHIRRALHRARPTKQELEVFRAYLSKTQVAMGTRVRVKQRPSF